MIREKRLQQIASGDCEAAAVAYFPTIEPPAINGPPGGYPKPGPQARMYDNPMANASVNVAMSPPPAYSETAEEFGQKNVRFFPNT